MRLAFLCYNDFMDTLNTPSSSNPRRSKRIVTFICWVIASLVIIFLGLFFIPRPTGSCMLMGTTSLGECLWLKSQYAIEEKIEKTRNDSSAAKWQKKIQSEVNTALPSLKFSIKFMIGYAGGECMRGYQTRATLVSDEAWDILTMTEKQTIF
jgi:hypothetical protein